MAREITARHNGGPPLDDGSRQAGDRSGWVAVTRSVRDHWLVGFGRHVDPCDPERGFCYSRAEAWLDLIMECRYVAGTVNNGGQRMEIKPGQLIGAVSFLGHRWNWTPKTVRGFLDRLQDEGMIERLTPGVTQPSNENREGSKRGKQKGKQSQIITLCNWDIYQLVSHMEGQAKRQAPGEQRASTGQAEGTQGASEGQQYKEEQGNQGTREPRNNKTAQPRAGVSDRDLSEQLLAACNGALDNPVNCQGLLMMAEPRMWLEQGCDLEKDILPTLRDMGRRYHGKRVRSWNFFSGAIADAKRAREKGAVTFNENGDVETKAQRLARIAMEAEQQITAQEFRK